LKILYTFLLFELRNKYYEQESYRQLTEQHKPANEQLEIETNLHIANKTAEQPHGPAQQALIILQGEGGQPLQAITSETEIASVQIVRPATSDAI
jgi:hypothetical protein